MVTKESIRIILNRYFPAGIDVRTTQFLMKRGITEEQLKFCRDNGILSLKDNHGSWVYQIMPNGIKLRDKISN